MTKVKLILNRFSWILFPMWAGSLCVVIASLMVGHWVSLPHPTPGTKLSINDGENEESSSKPSEFLTYHFLYSDCPCSRRVLKQIANRSSIREANEKVVLVGEAVEIESTLRQNGFEVEVTSPASLKSKWGVESAPLMVMTDREGTILYSGGYTSRKQGLDYQDEEIINQVISGEHVPGLPLYGCAVSKSLKALVDPLNLKY